jgi:hypothetical protein
MNKIEKPTIENKKYWSSGEDRILYNHFIADQDEYIEYLEEQLKINVALGSVSQQRELLEALKGIIQCCDGNEPKHEQIYHIANDAVKACNCG